MCLPQYKRTHAEGYIHCSRVMTNHWKQRVVEGTMVHPYKGLWHSYKKNEDLHKLIWRVFHDGVCKPQQTIYSM